MSEIVGTGTANAALIVPPSIDAVLDEFNARSDPYTVGNVHSAICAARKALEAPTSAENTGAWAEVLAFGLAGTEHNEKPWGTYFGPMGSGTRNGETVYFPDASEADATILAHWKGRARSVTSPVLTARYNDLVWDMSKFLANARRDVDFARRAIDAYIAAARQDSRDAYYTFPDAKRALALAIQIDDKLRRDSARETLLLLHRLEFANSRLWWEAYDALEDQPKSGLTEQERDALVADLESTLARVSDSSNPASFDPHSVKDVADRLIPHYRRVGRDEDIKRLYLAVARVFEHFGSMATPLLASTVLQTSMDAYREAGMPADGERILRLIEKNNVDSIGEMTRHEVKQEVSEEDVEAFLAQIIAETKEETFLRIAGEFLTKRSNVEEILEESSKSAPLSFLIPRTETCSENTFSQPACCRSLSWASMLAFWSSVEVLAYPISMCVSLCVSECLRTLGGGVSKRERQVCDTAEPKH